ncbi:MAG: restriction endonuclease subunit S [Oscillospiraceae bacterium]|nr:restriction endonuclease subunit S [Oscillospiraceae bacterium]
MKIINANIQEIKQDRLVRFNYKTLLLLEKVDSFFNENTQYIRLNELFNMVNGFAFSSNDYVGEGVSLVRIGDLNDDIVQCGTAFLPNSYLESYSNYIIKKGDILVSLTGDGKMKSAVSSNDNMLLNQRVGALRPKEDLNIMFYYYLLNTDIVKTQFELFSNGKSQLNISPKDFLNIRIPIIDKNKISQIMEKITPIEKALIDDKSKIISTQTIIDDIFAKKFGFDYVTFEKLKSKKRFTIDFKMFSNNPDLRFSVKFHRNAGEFVMKQITNITNKKIKHFLAEPIVLGASLSPNDYSDNGDYLYISMATIKNWCFDSDDAARLKVAYSNEKMSKTVKCNDILMARSGEGTIGKVALIKDDDFQGIFSDFTMRIRFANYNHLFAYYYLRTSYFQYLVEVYKKGLGNNTNIFPIVIQEFPVPDLTLSEQKRIVTAIQSEIVKQDNTRAKIIKLRKQIDDVIENVLT